MSCVPEYIEAVYMAGKFLSFALWFGFFPFWSIESDGNFHFGTASNWMLKPRIYMQDGTTRRKKTEEKF